MTHPFDHFLDAWCRAGGSDSLEVRLRVYAAFSIGETWSLPRIRGTLSAILAATPTDRERFDALFPRVFAREIVARAEDRKTEKTARHPRARERSVWMSVINTVMGRFGRYTKALLRPQLLWGVLGIAAAVAMVGAVMMLANPARDVVAGAGGAVFVASLVVLRRYYVRRQRSKFEPMPAALTNYGFSGPDLELRSLEPSQPLTRRELSEIAFNLGTVMGDTAEVDVARTVDATVRNQLLSIVHRRRRNTPRLIIVVGAQLDIVAAELVGHFCDGMRRTGLHVECLNDPPERFEYDVGLLVVDARAFSPNYAAWFASFRNIALVEARDPVLWGGEVRRLPACPYSLTPAGLRQALDAALRGRRDLPRGTPVAAANDLERLGAALPVAAAAALMQPVDLATLDRIRRRFAAELPFLAMQRILRLRGATASRDSLRFSPELTERLCNRAEQRPDFQPASVLSWHLNERLNRAQPPIGSRAEAQLQRETALAGVQALLYGEKLSELEVARHVAVLEAQSASPVLTSRTRERLQQVGGNFRARAVPTVRALTVDLQNRLSALQLIGSTHHDPTVQAMPASKAASNRNHEADSRLAVSLDVLLADLDRVAKLDQPIIRNLLITQRYHDLSRELTKVLGPSDANWATFATWASKTAGQSIREDEVPAELTEFFEREAKLSARLERFYAALGPLRRFAPRLDPFDLARAIIQEVAAQIAEGNLRVYAELAPLVAEFSFAFADPAQRTPEALAAFLQKLDPGPAERGGQDRLNQAFSAYFAASLSQNNAKRVELILFGNVLIGMHEQTRLQENIARALEAPFSARVYERFGGAGPKSLHRLLRALLRVGVEIFAPELLDNWQRLATRLLMKLASPNGEDIPLGEELPAERFDPLLTKLTNPELIALLSVFDNDLTSTRGSAAVNWTILSERMKFIGELFRVSQRDQSWFGPPFEAWQLLEVEAGRLPRRRL